MTAAFQQVGPQSRRELALEILRTKNPGDIATYDELASAIDVETRGLVQSAVGAAAKTLLKQDNRALEAVPNVGYRIVQAGEHALLAQRQQRRSSRALKRSRDVIQHVDYNELSAEGRALANAMGTLLAAQISFQERTSINQRRLDSAIESLSAKQDRSQDDIAELRARLERLEQPRGDA